MITQSFKGVYEVIPYSPVKHLAEAIWFSRWHEGYFGVFSAYFDASGFEETEFVSVAGFIAPVDVWNDFETAWLTRLSDERLFGRDGTPEFHMAECANRTYAYEQYRTDEQKRQILLRDLTHILSGLVRKIGCVANVNQVKGLLDPDVRNKFGLTAAYVLGGRACAARIKEWCWLDGSPQLSQVQLYFERGDGKEIQLDLRHRLLNDDYPTPQFKPKRNRYSNDKLIEHGLAPFQAADVLAYLYYLEAKYEGKDWRDKESIRWMLQELASIPEPRVRFTPELLAGLNTYLRAASVDLRDGRGKS
jgi:hypothetical protein